MSLPIDMWLRLTKTRSLRRGISNTSRMLRFHLSYFFAHSTLRKMVNFSLVKAQKWMRQDKVLGLPYRYVIDPINVCNLRCPLCPTGLGILGRKRGMMALDKFQSLIDQISAYAYLVELYNWGEPFLHPQIFEMVQYASSKRIVVKISSNLNHFNQEMAVKTIDSGLDWLLISIDGSTQEVYEKYRRGGNLEKVFANIEMLAAEKKKRNVRHPFIVARILVNKYNENQVEQLRKKCEQIGVDAFTVGTLFIDTSKKEQAQEWLPEDESLSFYEYESDELENVWHCADLWESMTINWDGGLAPCCWLHEEKHDYLNAFDMPLTKIWNDDSYISSRRVFSRGGEKEGPISTICTVCRGRPKYLND